MKILVAGAGGTIGSAAAAALRERGHAVVSVGRSSGDIRADLTNPAEVTRVYAEVGPLDAVVSAFGHAPFVPVQELTSADLLAAYQGKAAPQIDLVLQGLSVVGERGSFTLTSGILRREPVRTAAPSAVANGALEAFVGAAAAEIAPQRINIVSPSVLCESLGRVGHLFPGYPAVSAADVGQAFVRSVETLETGRVYELP